MPLLAAALAFEAAFGYPAAVFAAVRHPVVWIGALIGGLDRRLNRDTLSAAARRGNGVAAIVVVVLAAMVAGAVVQDGALLLPRWVGLAACAIVASSLLAQRSLYAHVAAVAEGLDRDGVAGGRLAVAMIVGRNPASLDAAGVARAAIESLAENFADGVVAPAIWCGLAGLPGIAAYKAINTADSMIGHRSARHAAFGWAAARLDDVVNLPASRLAALWLIAAAALHPFGDAQGAVRAVRRDAARHRSPNAGWPEAAMAGALGLRLAGPRVYGATLVEDAWMGCGRAEASAADIRRALALYRLACGLQIAVVVVLAVIARG